MKIKNLGVAGLLCLTNIHSSENLKSQQALGFTEIDKTNTLEDNIIDEKLKNFVAAKEDDDMIILKKEKIFPNSILMPVINEVTIKKKDIHISSPEISQNSVESIVKINEILDQLKKEKNIDQKYKNLTILNECLNKSINTHKKNIMEEILKVLREIQEEDTKAIEEKLNPIEEGKQTILKLDYDKDIKETQKKQQSIADEKKMEEINEGLDQIVSTINEFRNQNNQKPPLENLIDKIRDQCKSIENKSVENDKNKYTEKKQKETTKQNNETFNASTNFLEYLEFMINTLECYKDYSK